MHECSIPNSLTSRPKLLWWTIQYSILRSFCRRWRWTSHVGVKLSVVWIMIVTASDWDCIEIPAIITISEILKHQVALDSFVIYYINVRRLPWNVIIYFGMEILVDSTLWYDSVLTNALASNQCNCNLSVNVWLHNYLLYRRVKWVHNTKNFYTKNGVTLLVLVDKCNNDPQNPSKYYLNCLEDCLSVSLTTFWISEASEHIRLQGM
jgi:hypothetical protein